MHMFEVTSWEQKPYKNFSKYTYKKPSAEKATPLSVLDTKKK